MYWQLSAIIAAGLLGPLLAGGKRPLAPVLIGELAAGAILGQFGFGILQPSRDPFPALYEMGFVMLMLGAGTEVDLDSPDLRRGLLRGLLAMLLVFFVSVPVALAISIGLHLGLIALLVVLLAGSSAALAFPIISERKLTGPAVALLISWLALADGLTSLLMPLALTGPRRIPMALAGDAAMVAASALVIVLGSRMNNRPRIHAVIKEAVHESKKRHWALQLRLSLLLVIGLAAIAYVTGGSLLVAGFSAGIVLRRFHEPKRLTLQISGLANGFLVPLFFVLLGASLNLRTLIADPKAILLAVAMCVGSVFVHLVTARVVGPEKRLASGLLASVQLGLPAAAAALGLATNSIPPAIAAALVAGGCLTLIPATVGAMKMSAGSVVTAEIEDHPAGVSA